MNSLDALFSFDSIAIVGASDDPTRMGGTPIAILEKYGFPGRIYGVNPKSRTVQGHPCYATIDELPEPVDAVAFCLSAANLKAMLPALKRKGMEAVVVFSAGFSESGGDGAQLQAWLADFARDNDVAVLGPNCAGLISFSTRRSITFASAFAIIPNAPGGGVALLSQSGGVAVNIWADAVLAGTRFSHVITTGNEAALDFPVFLDYLARDDSTRVVLGYLEGLRDGAAFCAAAARMQQARKPLILMKVGRSAAAQDAAASHTAQLASDDAGFDAAFERYGIVRVATFQDLIDHSRVFSLEHLGPRVAVATNSGGAGVYVADLCDELGLELTPLAAETERQLGTMIPSFGRVRNPVDLTAQVVNDMSFLERSLRIVFDDPGTDVLVFAFSGKGREQQAAELMQMLHRLQAATPKTMAVCWLGVPQAIRSQACAAGLLVYQDPAAFLRPLAAYLRTASAPLAPLAPTVPLASDCICVGDVQRLLRPDARGVPMLGEHDALTLLERAGVDCPKRRVAHSVEEIDRIAADIAFPCVAKIARPVLTHKSDAGGVILAIHSRAALVEAWSGLHSRLGAEEVLVAEQVTGELEVLVGWIRDETFGLRLTVGCGGVWANFIAETRSLIPPFDDACVRHALERLPIHAALAGRRGRRPLALAKLVAAIVAIGDLGMLLRDELAEFECNPVIVTTERAVVVDAVGFAGKTTAGRP